MTIIVPCAIGLLVGGAVDSVVSQADMGFPMEKLLSTGAAGVSAVIVWLFLKREEKKEAMHAETIRNLADRFSATQTACSADFAKAVSEAREAAQQNEARLHEKMDRLIEAKR